MALTVSVEMDPASRRKIEALRPGTVDRALRDGTRNFQIWSLRRLPRHTHAKTTTRTGTTARGWRTAQPQPGVLEFWNRARWSHFLEWGTRAHFVRPVHKKALRWRTDKATPVSAFRASPGAGRFAFSKGHMVRGIKALYIFLGFWRTNSHRLGRFISEALTRALPAR